MPTRSPDRWNGPRVTPPLHRRLADLQSVSDLPRCEMLVHEKPLKIAHHERFTLLNHRRRIRPEHPNHQDFSQIDSPPRRSDAEKTFK